MNPKLAVVVLNWNGLSDTLECLASLQQADYPHFETIVVDNGSSDESCNVIPARFPQVTFIATGENLGWAGGNNVGIREALKRGFEQVFLLNNDTVVSSDCLSRLMAAAEKTGPALLHPAVYFFDEPDVAQLDPTASKPVADKSVPVALNYAFGAALMVPAAVFEKIGLIDERFFLEFEETDFFIRARAVGIGSYCASDARLLHKESRSYGGRMTPRKTYYIVRNTFLIRFKHARALGGRVQGLKTILWDINGIISKARNLPKRWRASDLFWLLSADQMASSIRLGIFDACRGRFGKGH